MDQITIKDLLEITRPKALRNSHGVLVIEGRRLEFLLTLQNNGKVILKIEDQVLMQTLT